MLSCPTNRAHIKLKKYKKRKHICSNAVIMELARNQKTGEQDMLSLNFAGLFVTGLAVGGLSELASNIEF